MNKKDILIIIIGIIILGGIVLASFFLPGGQEEIKQGIAVITDREEYNIGDELKVKIVNNIGERICFSR